MKLWGGGGNENIETDTETVGAKLSEPYKYFKNIYNELLNTSDYKNKTTSKQFKNLTDSEKNKTKLDLFYKYAFNIEKEKMTYLALTYNNETLIISSPIENDAQEKFLGYKWSNRKGQEGLQIIKYGGELYYDREKNPNDYDKIFASDLVKEMFDDNAERKYHELESELLQGKYHRMRTCEMFDFNKVVFSNSINTTESIKRDYDYEVTEYKLNNKDDFSLQIGNRVLQNEIIENGQYPIYSANVKEEFGRINKLNLDNFKISSILWGIDGDFMTNIIDKNIPFYPTDHCGVLRVLTNDILPKYAMYALQREGELQKFSRTNRASIDRIKALTFYIPNIDKQKEIVSVLDEIDIKINKIHSQVEEINNLIDKQLNDKLNNNKEKTNLDEYCDFINGYAFDSKSFSGNGVPVIKIKNIKDDYIQIDDNSRYNDEIDDKLGKFIVKKGDILLAMTGATVGKVGIYNYDDIALLNQRVLCIRPKKNLLYIYYILKSKSIYNQIQILATGNAQKNISDSQIKRIQIVKVDDKYQLEFSKFATQKEEEKNKLNAQKEKLLNKKEALIQKYFK